MPNYQADPIYWQRFLTSLGFYHRKIDGDWGDNSKAAAEAFEAAGEAIAVQLGRFDPRSESKILSLHPVAQGLARQFMAVLTQSNPFSDGWFATIGSGTRTYAEQDAIYEKGRSKPGHVVTNARGGQSNHNFGLAFDLSLYRADGVSLDDLEDAKKVTEKYSSSQYRKAAKAGKKLGLFWGGDWSKFTDVPHYQVFDDAKRPAIRKKFEAGQPIP